MLNRFLQIQILIMILLPWIGIGCDSDREAVRIENQDFRKVTASSGLVLREEPNTTSTKLALIPLGTEVQVLEEKAEKVQIGDTSGRWVRVNHNGIRGWVFGAYLASPSKQ